MYDIHQSQADLKGQRVRTSESLTAYKDVQTFVNEENLGNQREYVQLETSNSGLAFIILSKNITIQSKASYYPAIFIIN